ncbi:hypothetical protein [Hymenobacter sp. CRA2]|uniref:hypothetical protein n=1 Tax=Hymenobacter sp. CRA2 TaxID=1955620 RepID=UPI00098F1904|nr:hypothetical protein [Hymenobacter sp. CRA2]OON66727.1 hypothetical protein B0919_21325 [Hymenobacter sp. CRA2]
MKTLGLSALVALVATATAAPATAQTRPASPVAGRTASAKPAATATKTTAAKPAATAAKPATTATKPAAVAPKPAAEPEAAPVAPKATTEPAKKAAPKASTARGTEFGKGSTAANLGVGFGLGYGYGILGGNVRSTPALSLSVERGITDNVGPGVISIGGLVGYKSYGWKSGSYKSSWKNFIVSARGAYHYNILNNPKVDTYAGLSLGVRVESYSDNWSDSQYSNSYGGAALTSGIFLGGRYMFSDNLGAFGELGYDMSYLKLGLTARF